MEFQMMLEIWPPHAIMGICTNPTVTTISLREAPVIEHNKNATIQVVKIIDIPAETGSQVAVVTCNRGLMAINQIQTAKQT